MVTRKECRILVTILKDDASKLIGRFVSVPRMTEEEQKGAKQFVDIMLKGIKSECKCPMPKTREKFEKGFYFYKKGKIGKAAISMGGAGVYTYDEAKKCRLV